jgi:hypothetical protein
MTLDLNDFIKDINKIDKEDICSDWQWLLEQKYLPIMVSCSGDMFLTGTDNAIYWLDSGIGKLTLVAEDISNFYTALEDADNFNKWLLASTVLDLIENGISLKDNQVYSYKQMPILNGDYSMENFDTTDISVHFSITGQICRQIRKPDNGIKLPDGTLVDKVLINPFIKN